MIIETRVFNRKTKTMVYFEPLVPSAAGVVCALQKGVSTPESMVQLDQNDPVMLKSSMLTATGEPLWEGDICDCAIVWEMGLIKSQGVLVWRGDKGGFILQLAGMDFLGQRDFQISDVKRVGNIFETPELIPKKQKYVEKS